MLWENGRVCCLATVTAWFATVHPCFYLPVLSLPGNLSRQHEGMLEGIGEEEAKYIESVSHGDIQQAIVYEKVPT